MHCQYRISHSQLCSHLCSCFEGCRCPTCTKIAHIILCWLPQHMSGGITEVTTTCPHLLSSWQYKCTHLLPLKWLIYFEFIKNIGQGKFPLSLFLITQHLILLIFSLRVFHSTRGCYLIKAICAQAAIIKQLNSAVWILKPEKNERWWR